MTRGLMKMQAKEKRLKKDASAAVQIDGKAAREAQLKYVCAVCKQQLSDLAVYKIHFEAKHPKAPAPAELA